MHRIVLFLGAAFGIGLAQFAVAADNGDGTYTNPPLYADFPDPDVIRVGDDFYMVSTTFMNSPGLALLHSKDMVNWTTINNIVDRLEFGNDPRQDMVGGTLYRNGIYAPSIRYNNGTFYVAVQPNGISGNVPLQIFRTTDPHGEWQRNQLNFSAFDPALHFEDDGTPYVVYGGAWQDNTFMRQLNSGLTSSVGGEQVINSVAGTSLPRLEGAHVIKSNGYYYIFNAAPGQGRMYISRSSASSLATSAGMWTTVPSVSGATGGHQGAIVELEGGDWYGFVMRDSGAVGRMTNISPISWQNDWPIWGTNNQVPGQAPKPILGEPIVLHPQSTGFDGPNLSHDFRWNHNPDDSRWSLAERPGYLRLRPTVAPDFWNARNSLTYKGFGPTSQAVVEMDISNLQTGDSAGLGMIGKGLATLAVKRLANGEAQLVLSTGTATANSGPVTEQATAALGNADTVYLTLRMDFTQNQGQTAYSLDGINWNTIGNSFPLLWDWATGTFQGEQYAVFNFNAGASTGFVDVNRLSFVQRSDFDLDGDLDADDYARLRTYHLANLAGDSPLETFAFGDVDGDLDNDYNDFRLFKQDYVAAHGTPALNAVVAGFEPLPEPCAFILMFLGMAIIVSGARWRPDGNLGLSIANLPGNTSNDAVVSVDVDALGLGVSGTTWRFGVIQTTPLQSNIASGLGSQVTVNVPYRSILALVIPPAPGVSGDYSDDATVDAAHYAVSCDTMVLTGNLRADCIGNVLFDDGDYEIWIAHFGETSGAGTAATVPEPSCVDIVLAVLAISMVYVARRR